MKKLHKHFLIQAKNIQHSLYRLRTRASKAVKHAPIFTVTAVVAVALLIIVGSTTHIFSSKKSPVSLTPSHIGLAEAVPACISAAGPICSGTNSQYSISWNECNHLTTTGMWVTLYLNGYSQVASTYQGCSGSWTFQNLSYGAQYIAKFTDDNGSNIDDSGFFTANNCTATGPSCQTSSTQTTNACNAGEVGSGRTYQADYNSCTGGWGSWYIIADNCSVAPPTVATGLNASCVNNVATFNWTEPAGTTFSELRVADNAYTWTGCSSPIGCFNNEHSSKSISGLYGTYGWWVHTCNAGGCSSAAGGPGLSCGATGSISANPNPCTIPAGQSACTATISWSTTNASNPGVFLRENSGLFATGPSGAQNAPWISSGGYNFDLHQTTDINSPILSSVFVRGNVTAAVGTVQGYRVDANGNYLPQNFGTTISAAGLSDTGRNPYFIFNVPAGNQVVSSTVPPGYDVSYLSTSAWVKGSAVAVTVPANGAKDLWWMYNMNPNATDDSADCSTINGWAYDPDSPATSISVHIYKDGPSSTGTFVGSYTTSTYRSDVNAGFGLTGNHGFSIPTPAIFKDGSAHTLYMYAIDSTGGGNPLVANTPRTLTCAPAVPPTPTMTQSSCDAGGNATLSWNAVSGATSYHPIIKMAPGTPSGWCPSGWSLWGSTTNYCKQWPITGTTITASSMPILPGYEGFVYAYNPGGWSGESAHIAFNCPAVAAPANPTLSCSNGVLSYSYSSAAGANQYFPRISSPSGACPSGWTLFTDGHTCYIGAVNSTNDGIPGTSGTFSPAAAGNYTFWVHAGNGTYVSTASSNATATCLAASQPNLTAGTVTPTTATLNSPVTLSATVSNGGTGSTGASFSNFFQIASAAGGAGTITDLAATTMGTLAAGANNVATKSYTFAVDKVYSARLCADKSSSASSGTIAESNESDNCGAWTNITVGTTISADLRGNGCILALNGSGCDITSYWTVTGLPGGETVDLQVNGPGLAENYKNLPVASILIEKAKSLAALVINALPVSRSSSSPFPQHVTQSGSFLFKLLRSSNGVQLSTAVALVACPYGYTIQLNPSTGLEECVAPTPSLVLIAAPAKVRSGSSSTLTWSAVNVQSCQIKNPAGVVIDSATSNASKIITSRDVSTGTITSTLTYTLLCTDLNGGSISKSINIGVLPVFQEQ